MSSQCIPSDEQVWTSYARSYDRILPILPFYQEAVRRHVEALTGAGMRRVIDVGTGTGNVAVHLASRGVEVTAMDVSGAMLDQLRGKIQTGLPGRIEIVEQDAHLLNRWPEAAFDGANVLLSLFAMHEPRQVLREIIRVVRPGGLIVATETRRSFQLKRLLDFVDDFVERHSSRDGLREHWDRVRSANLVLDPGRRSDRLSVEEIRDELAMSGFTIHSVLDSHLGQCATICAQKKPCVEKKAPQ
jgi:ubiquinone/menaquinone biosynthesis C-methylase UbiE